MCSLKLGAARNCFFLVVSLGIVAALRCTASCCFSVCPKVSASEQTWAGLGVECDDPLASLTKTTLCFSPVACSEAGTKDKGLKASMSWTCVCCG